MCIPFSLMERGCVECIGFASNVAKVCCAICYKVHLKHAVPFIVLRREIVSSIYKLPIALELSYLDFEQ